MYIIQYALQATWWVLANLVYVILPLAILITLYYVVRDTWRAK